jgi:hypothetical protein
MIAPYAVVPPEPKCEGTGGGTPSVIFTRRDRSHAPVVNVELMESNDFSLIDNVVADLRAQSRQPRRK